MWEAQFPSAVMCSVDLLSTRLTDEKLTGFLNIRTGGRGPRNYPIVV